MTASSRPGPAARVLETLQFATSQTCQSEPITGGVPQVSEPPPHPPPTVVHWARLAPEAAAADSSSTVSANPG